MERLLGTIIFSDRDGNEQHRRKLFQRQDGSYYIRETWQQSVDQEDGHIYFARSMQMEASRSDAWCLCREYFRQDPDNCRHEFFTNRRMTDAQYRQEMQSTLN